MRLRSIIFRFRWKFASSKPSCIQFQSQLIIYCEVELVDMRWKIELVFFRPTNLKSSESSSESICPVRLLHHWCASVRLRRTDATYICLFIVAWIHQISLGNRKREWNVRHHFSLYWRSVHYSFDRHITIKHHNVSQNIHLVQMQNENTMQENEIDIYQH